MKNFSVESRKNISLLSLSICLIISACQSPIHKEDLIGHWTFSFDPEHNRITFNEDGTYLSSTWYPMQEDTARQWISGNYSIDEKNRLLSISNIVIIGGPSQIDDLPKTYDTVASDTNAILHIKELSKNKMVTSTNGSKPVEMIRID